MTMLTSIRSSLKGLGFQAKDIMHPWSKVMTVIKSDDPLLEVYQRNILFDYIPIIDSKKICGIVDRKGKKCEYSDKELISPQTHLLDIIEILYLNHENNEPTFLFIGEKDKPKGIINHADLNKKSISVLLYIVLSDFEIKLSKLIVNNIDENFWLKVLSESEKNDIFEKYNNEKANNIELDLIHYTMLRHKLKILINIKDLWEKLGYKSQNRVKTLYKINKWRNRVSHKSNKKDLIYDKNDLNELWGTLTRLDEALELLNQLENI